MNTSHPKLWFSPAEAAEYLCCSVNSVERRLIKMKEGPAPGRLRFRRIDDWNALSTAEKQRATPIRVLGDDVYHLLPLPPGVEDAEQIA